MKLFIDCKKLPLLHVYREIKTVALLVITYKQRSVRINMYTVRIASSHEYAHQHYCDIVHGLDTDKGLTSAYKCWVHVYMA